MTPKEHILAFVHRMDDKVTMKEVLYKLDLFLNIQIGLQQLDEGKYVDHDELFESLLNDDEENPNSLVRARQGKPSGNKRVHRNDQ